MKVFDSFLFFFPLSARQLDPLANKRTRNFEKRKRKGGKKKEVEEANKLSNFQLYLKK